MKKTIDLEKLNSVEELKMCEMTNLYGGGFWGDLFFAGAATVHFIGYMLADAHKNPIRPSEYR
ncbi:MAG: hypothetical protein WKI04_08845 [Ferruginibacter sp.]